MLLKGKTRHPHHSPAMQVRKCLHCTKASGVWKLSRLSCCLLLYWRVVLAENCKIHATTIISTIEKEGEMKGVIYLPPSLNSSR